MEPRKTEKKKKKNKIEEKLTNPDNLLIRNIKDRIKGSKFNKNKDFLGVKRNEALRKLQESMK
tara:strand:+ start:2010 stop:2198 length:189 start_codon:yes stop_codon:yes gene_type:complete